MYVADRVANRYTRSLEGRGVGIDGKERNLCLGEEERDVCKYGGGGRVAIGQLKKERYSFTAYRPCNICFSGHKKSSTPFSSTSSLLFMPPISHPPTSSVLVNPPQRWSTVFS